MATNGGNDDSSDNEEQAFYVGGSEHSGQQVIGRDGRKPEKIIKSVFDSARSHGAEVVTSGESGEAQSKPAFSGTGYKLGETEDDTEVIKDQSAPQKKKVDVTLKLWQNGFSIEAESLEEELRSYTDPKNQALLSAVSRGIIPDELVRLAGEGETVNVEMEDHRDESFVPPKKKTKPFSGSGQTLGSPTPNFTSNSSLSNASEPTVTVDESQPTTTLQIRLADGTRKVQKFNQSQTVGDIRQYVAGFPAFQAATFLLQTTFPVTILSDDDKTIKDANLLNAVIIQKLT